MDKNKFELGRLDTDYLSELSGIEINGYRAARLGLWCEDVREDMSHFGPRDSVSMAKKLSELSQSLGTIWPSDGDPGIAKAQMAVMQGLAASKGFELGGKDFSADFTAAMAEAGSPGGYKAIYKAVAGNIRGDGASRDGYGRELHENGRPEAMWYLSPGRYANEMRQDNERIRTELYGEDPLRPRAAQPEAQVVTQDAPPRKQSAWEKLKAALGGGASPADRERSGPEL